MFINNIADGLNLKEKFKNCQHIYSDEDKKAELHEIAVNEKFMSETLITTKVAENGLSLHDEKLSVIVAETYDPITLQQIIGRARISRRNPREITVLIPDYSLSQLGSIEGKLYMQLKEFQKAIENPDFAMQYLPQPNPYIYYDAILKKPVVNYIGYNQIQKQIDYIQSLKEEEQKEPHAFIRNIQRLLFLPETIEDKQFLNYNDLAKFKSAVQTAYNEFVSSPKLKADRDKLAKDLIKVVSETSIYPKKITGNQIQIDKINDILDCAGISAKIQSLGETFGLIE